MGRRSSYHPMNTIDINKQVTAYQLLFIIENKLRVTMHNIMVKNKGSAYFTNQVFPEFVRDPPSENKKTNVVMLAEQRKGYEKEYNIALGYDYPYFWYLDFTILISLLDAFWDKYFYKIFRRPKKRVKDEILNRLRNIVKIRNAIAHNRYISNIDLADLESSLKILDINLDDDFLTNFAEIALNSFETLVNTFISYCTEIQSTVKRGKYIDKFKIDKLQSLFSVILSITENTEQINCFEKLVVLFKEYNKLPRKPGKGDLIKLFKKDSDIEDLLSLLIRMMGDNI